MDPRRTPAPEDWSGLRSRRLREHRGRELVQHGPLVSVFVPRFRSRWLMRIGDRFGLRPYQVHLDAVGSFVWLRCDGRHEVREIGEELLNEFGEEVAPGERRLATFLRQLARGRLVTLESE